MASAAQPEASSASAARPPSNVIDIDAGSDLSTPPAGPSRESSILSPPPDPTTVSTAATTSSKKKIALSQSKPIKATGSAGKAASKKATQNGTGKAAPKDDELDEPSGSWQPPEPVPRLVPGTMEDDWQIPYIWSFIDKFEVKVKGLFTIDDLETGLQAHEPNDVLVEIILIFLNNLLKKGVKKANTDTLTTNLSSFIDSRLQPNTPATVWDPYAYTPYVQRRPKSKAAKGPAANGKGKGKAPAKVEEDNAGEEEEDSGVVASRRAAEAKAERLGRNPLRERGLWELNWHEKATVLRQLIDWQLVECEAIRGYIDELYSSKKIRKETPITLEPLNKDSENKRIWAFEPTHRLYTQTNPLHFASEWHKISHNGETYEQVLDKYVSSGATYGQKALERRTAKGKAAKAKAAKAEAGAQRDFDIGKALEKRKEDIQAFQITLNERRTKYREAQLRARKKRERDEANEAYRAGLVTHQTRRSTRNAAINYKEPVEEEFSEPEEEPTYTRPKRGRLSDESAADTPNGYTNNTTADVSMEQSEDEADERSDGHSSRASSFRAEDEEEEESVGGSEDEDGKRARSEDSGEEEASGAPHKKRRVVVEDSEDEDEYVG